MHAFRLEIRMTYLGIASSTETCGPWLGFQVVVDMQLNGANDKHMLYIDLRGREHSLRPCADSLRQIPRSVDGRRGRLRVRI